MMIAVAIAISSELGAQAEPAGRELRAPAPVEQIIRRACYDCHSDETRWPWYSNIPLLSSRLKSEVDEGRKRLNFSAWQDYASDPGTEGHKLENIARLLKSGAMPPWYYLAMHPSARMSDADRAAIASWIAGRRKSLEAGTDRFGTKL